MCIRDSLGFDWKLSLASLTGTAGKEVVVSTIGTLFSLSDNAAEEREDNNVNLSEQEKVMSSISDAYHPLTGYNFMLFSLLYFPCIASLAVFQKEAGFKELMFQVVFTMALAWVVSFIVYQIGRFFI